MPVLTRRHVLAGAAATVAAAALPAVAVASHPQGLVLGGSHELATAAEVGDLYFDDASMEFFEMTERGWAFLPKDAK